jgi:ribosomal protein L32
MNPNVPQKKPSERKTITKRSETKQQRFQANAVNTKP